MGFVPFDKVMRLEAVFRLDGQVVENVHHFWQPNEFTIDVVEDVCEAYKLWWVANLKPIVPDGVSLIKVIGTILDTENSPGIEYTTGLPVVGDSTSAEMPNNVSIAIRWNTGFRGRSYRGRTFHVGLTDGMVDGNNVTVATQNALLAAYTQLMILDTTPQAVMLGVASRVADGVERVTGVFTPVTGVVIDPVVDSQRRRLPNRGR